VSLRSWRRALALVAALALGASLVVVVAEPASASKKLRDAKQRAARIRVEIQRLEDVAEIATEDYNEARVELARAVSVSLNAQRDLDAARASTQERDDLLGDRVRALYMTGGAFGMYASMLEAGDIGEALDRYAQINSVVTEDRLALDHANDALALATAAEQRLDAAASLQTRIEAKVANAASRVTDALRAQHALLASANDEIRRIIDEDRRAAEEAAARAFAARLAGARGYTGDPSKVLSALRSDTNLPVSPIAAAAIAAARSQIGKPYQWGATGPATFDCSGLTGWAYARAGVNLPRTSRQQWFAGSHPELADLLPGDLLFWGSNPDNPSSIHHVALYIGGGLMIAAPHTGARVQIQPVYATQFFGATRPGSPVPEIAPTKTATEGQGITPTVAKP
jgi:cell wall-associated NlpC family hydrolase